MLKQKTISNWEIPPELSNRSFRLKEIFALGDSEGTNIARRPQNFVDTFLRVACKTCCLPESILGEDVCDISFEEISRGASPWDIRIPIKVVGHLVSQQRNGGRGILRIATPNHFICRYLYQQNGGWAESLQIVTLQFLGGWVIDNTPLNEGRHYFPQPCRVFFGIR